MEYDYSYDYEYYYFNIRNRTKKFSREKKELIQRQINDVLVQNDLTFQEVHFILNDMIDELNEKATQSVYRL